MSKTPMKALPFIDYFNNLVAENNPNALEKAKAYSALVNTPFEPEMILSVFEGFTQLEDKREFEMGGFRVFLNDQRVGFVAYSMTYPKGVRDAKYLSSYYAPKTLNDFISDCQRAGIELWFNPKVVSDYE